MGELTPWEVFEPSRGIVREFSGAAMERGQFILERRRDAAVVLIDQGMGDPMEMPRPLVYHSPDGFEWGYLGSGPADLALNILARFVEPPEAWRLHHQFKAEVLAGIPQEGGAISAEFVRDWLLEQWAGEVSHGRG